MTRHTLPKMSGREGGFSLIELMVGMTIGLLCTLVIATVLGVAEGQRRGTTAGSDAQVGGSLALYAVQREVAMAGYGFASEPSAVGCPLRAFFNSTALTIFPAQLVPVLITRGGDAQSDQIRTLASSKYIDNSGAPNQVGYSVPTRITPPLYNPLSSDAKLRTTLSVYSTLGMRAGDLVVAVVNTDTPCSLLEVVQQPGALDRELAVVANPARWNPNNYPAEAMQRPCLPEAGCTDPPNPTGSLLVNLGAVSDVNFSVDDQNRLVASRLDTSTLTRTVNILQGNIVMFKAMYGRDTNNNGDVDVYDYVTPTTSAGWAQVLAVRLAVVARSSQWEREEVTTSAPLWDVGKGATVAGTVACGESQCLPLPVTRVPDWTHYRYKVFDLVVPLRNQRWRS